jgi:uncharacterized protein with HEPN domain
MTRVASPAIHDILETIERVQSKMAGKTFVEFEADWEFRFVIQRAIEIISEATRRIPDELKAMRPEIRRSQYRGYRQRAQARIPYDIEQGGLGRGASGACSLESGDRSHCGERRQVR